MEIDQFVKLVRKHFGFLIKDYGFNIVDSTGPGPFGNCGVGLQLEYVRIEIVMDRLWISASISNINDSSSQKYTIPTIISFLTNGKFDWEARQFWDDPKKPIGPQLKKSAGLQMEIISKISEPYWNYIISLFQDENFKTKQKELNAFVRKRLREKWKKSKTVDENAP